MGYSSTTKEGCRWWKDRAFGLRSGVWEVSEFCGQITQVVGEIIIQRWFFLCRDRVQLTTGLMAFVADRFRRGRRLIFLDIRWQS